MQSKQWSLLLVLGLSNTLACSSDGSDDANHPTPTKPEGSGAAPGDSRPEVAGTPVAWDDAEPDGIAPAEAFAKLSGSCEASLEWESEDDSFTSLQPASGTSAVTVTVAFDESSARLVSSCGSGNAPCAHYLSASAHVSVRSADGTFADESDADVRYSKGGDNYISFRVPADELGGALRITTKGKGTEASLGYTVLSVGTACQGRVELNVSVPHEDGRGGTGFVGRFGEWSSNGCEAGATPVDLTTPVVQGASLKTALSDLWRAKLYTGQWDDGTATQLSLTVSDVPDVACLETTPFNPAVMVPVRLTYSTNDGRIPQSTVSANVRVSGEGTGSRSLTLDADHEAECASPRSSLPYTPARCDQGVAKVLLQVHVNDSVGSSGSSGAGASVTVYQYAEGSDGSGAADAVHTFSTWPQ